MYVGTAAFVTLVGKTQAVKYIFSLWKGATVKTDLAEGGPYERKGGRNHITFLTDVLSVSRRISKIVVYIFGCLKPARI